MIWFALADTAKLWPFAVLAISVGLIITLITVRARGDATDIWEIMETELPSVLSGIEVAEQCIGVLDVALLEQTADALFIQMTDE